jgi:asparagine synthase (glutamine-hydrolysing)
MMVGCYYFYPQNITQRSSEITEVLKFRDPSKKKLTGLYTDNRNLTIGYTKSDRSRHVTIVEDDDFIVCLLGTIEKINSKCVGRNRSGNSIADLILFELHKNKKNTFAAIEGIYTCVTLSKKNNQLAVYTDRCGLELTYYYLDKSQFIFSTELSPIVKLINAPVETNLDGVFDIFAFSTILDNKTLISGINILPHAAHATLTEHGIEIEKYWDFPVDYEYKNIHKSDDEYLTESIRTIDNAVKLTTSGHDELGIMLTGGLDSRLLAAVADQYAGNIKAYSFGDSSSLDSILAGRIAKQLNLQAFLHDAIQSDPIDDIVNCIYDTDGQWGFFDLLPYVRQIGEENPRIALINGYLMDTFFKSGWALFPHKQSGDIVTDLLQLYSTTGNYIFERFFSRDFYQQIIQSKNKSICESISGLPEDSPVESSIRFYILNRGRRAHNLAFNAFRKYVDVILPGNDYDLMDYSFSLPYSLRSSPQFYLRLICQWFPEIALIPWDRTGKPLQYGLVAKNRRIVNIHNLLKYVAQRVTKGRMDFVNPKSSFNWKFRFDKIFQQSMIDILCDRRTFSRGYFDQTGIESLIKAHMTGKDYASTFQSIITIEMFHRLYVDNKS